MTKAKKLRQMITRHLLVSRESSLAHPHFLRTSEPKINRPGRTPRKGFTGLGRTPLRNEHMRFLGFRKSWNDGVCYPFTLNLRPYEAVERGSPRSLEGSSSPRSQPEGKKLGVGTRVFALDRGRLHK